jgi:UDP-N-acetyl-D-glucosamine/UDP-N-acetyl-D-galactosamine dehydrogenase
MAGLFAGAGMDINNCKIAVIGLGYVGLPLMVEFAKKYPTLGFDINSARIQQLREGNDLMKDLSKTELQEALHGSFSDDANDLANFNVYIITVPTPVDKQKRPDLSTLENSCQLIGSVLAPGDVVIFESTVFPGATE